LAVPLGENDVHGQLRDVIQASWRRSAAAGLTPDQLRVAFGPDIQSDGPLVQAARPILEQLTADLAATRVAVVTADARGQVIDRRAPDQRLAAHLDQIQLVPGFLYAEAVVGTNGIGTALVERKQTVVEGEEHFADALTAVASAGAPIFDVSSGRVLGVLDLTCFAVEASAFMLPLAARAARDIEQRLIDRSGIAARIVLQRFLQERRRAAGPLVLITDRTIVTNAAADRVLSVNDELVLRECAVRIRRGNHIDKEHVTLSDGTEATIDGEAVLDGLSPVGVLLRVRPLGNGGSLGGHSNGNSRAFGWDSLTDTERSVSDLLVQGLTNRQVGERLFISRHTVDYHRRSIFRKLGVSSRVELTRLAMNRSTEGDPSDTLCASIPASA
jgi:DNA-binding CsgD family transcriptional regulator